MFVYLATRNMCKLEQIPVIRQTVVIPAVTLTNSDGR